MLQLHFVKGSAACFGQLHSMVITETMAKKYFAGADPIGKTLLVTAPLKKIETAIQNNNPGYPFGYRFIDEVFGQLFLQETQIGNLASVFAVLAIFISCLGLFGLAAYMAERRTKEIGVRKVLGASTAALAALLSKEFLQLVAIACLIAFPAAWWAMHSWLADPNYSNIIFKHMVVS